MMLGSRSKNSYTNMDLNVCTRNIQGNYVIIRQLYYKQGK